MKSTYTVAIVTAIVLITWLISGQIEAPEVADDAETSGVDTLGRVQTRISKAVPYVVQVRATGETEAKRIVKVRAESSGRVISLPVEKGVRVSKGDLLCKLALDDREIKLEKAKSQLRHAKLEHQGLKKLRQQGFQGEVKIAAAEVNLINAQANLKLQELNLAHRDIIAPFDGLVQSRPVNTGDFLQQGLVCADVLDPDPMLVVAHVTQQELGDLNLAGAADVRIDNRAVRQGSVSFISHAADAVTRTYRVEVEVPNDDYSIRDGLSAELILTQGSVMAHNVSPASLSLSDTGAIGAKIVNNNDLVEFVEVELVSDTATGVWLTGLPPNAKLITVGQELVFSGQRVIAVPETTLAAGN